MSDNGLRYVPSDPFFQPSIGAAENATALIHSFLPEAEEVTAEFHDGPAFIDPGGNWSGVLCSACGADADCWWGKAVSIAADHFASLDTVAQCCQVMVSRDELDYVWPAAFGRFVLDAVNPNVERLSAAEIEALGAAIGCAVREIPQHL